MKALNADGYTDISTKEIKVLKPEEKPGNQKNIFKYQNTVLRHEIIMLFYMSAELTIICSFTMKKALIFLQYSLINLQRFLKMQGVRSDLNA